ncbi:hypothetical protein O181_033923 [Austropuccinia psidii MF-1]|uniref:Non-structural maintenance of chromosomes element 1 homolog n=1 Tax=Austropuccinia psidii MF-1 TaxID=1389203 RepID=A0A9Q3D2F8_9BASI|nr:hypothetical protein [Austropuccinia psidii MF-1]
MSALSVHHHLFVQAMLLRRVATFDQWLKVWKQIAKVLKLRVQDNEFLTFYGQINYNIEPFGFRIDLMIDEGNGPIDVEEIQNNISSNRRAQPSRWMALVNTRSDSSSKLGSEFTPIEISLYKKIIDKIVLHSKNRFCVSYHDAIRLSSMLETPLKKSDAEKTLSAFVRKGWLSLSSNGFYTLSARARLELKAYLMENYGEDEQPPVCASCREVVMRGFKCPNGKCPKAMHEACLINNARQSNACPACKSKWSFERRIGESAPLAPYAVSAEEDESESLSTSQRHSGIVLPEEEEDIKPDLQPDSSRRRSTRSRPSQSQSRRNG